MTRYLDDLLDELASGFVPASPPPYDLRALYRRVGRLPGELAELPTRTQVRMLEGSRAHAATAAPVEVLGVIDGIQPPSRALCWREGRPIGFLYVAAGCLGLTERRMLFHEERLLLVVSHLDAHWVRSISQGVPVVILPERFPAELAAAITELHRRLRHRLERDVLEAARGPDHLVVVDGHLRDVSPHGGPVVGVVKSHAAQYVSDERDLVALPAGQLSAAFLLPALRDGEADRWSAYLRLHPAGEAEWTHGLVRLEATDGELLDGVAAWCLCNRQPPNTDPRWPVHLDAIAACEQHLRSRIPPVM